MAGVGSGARVTSSDEGGVGVVFEEDFAFFGTDATAVEEEAEDT